MHELRMAVFETDGILVPQARHTRFITDKNKLILTSLPHSLQVSISILNTRFKRPLMGPTLGVPKSLQHDARPGFDLVCRLRAFFE